MNINPIHRVSPYKRWDILPFICLHCSKSRERLYALNRCAKCLRDDGLCLGCGKETQDDSLRHCIACMPCCKNCDELTDSPNQDGICDDCVDAAWARRSVKPASWNGNSMVAP